MQCDFRENEHTDICIKCQISIYYYCETHRVAIYYYFETHIVAIYYYWETHRVALFVLSNTLQQFLNVQYIYYARFVSVFLSILYSALLCPQYRLLGDDIKNVYLYILSTSDMLILCRCKCRIYHPSNFPCSEKNNTLIFSDIISMGTCKISL